MKKETLEEAAERHTYGNAYQNFIRGAKWQQEQDKKMYSEEDMLKLVNALNKISQFSDIGNDFSAVVKMKSIAVDAINQFKNK